MTHISRRTFAVAGGLLVSMGGACSSLPGPGGAEAALSGAAIDADLRRYVGFGNKRAGGPGDTACGEWLAGELKSAGYAIERQAFQAPFFEATRAEFTTGSATAQILPQPIVIPTAAGGISGQLVRVDSAGRFSGPMRGAIALVDLDNGRWSTMLAAAVRGPVEAAFAAGAKAVVAITNGPTRKVIALNADGRRPMFRGPVALLAPEDAAPFLAGALRGQEARLLIEGNGGQRPAFNFVGRIDRRKGRWLAVSTPRSGWFTCAAERGPGVAVWLNLARWAPAVFPDYDLAFVCNTGHEYEYLGAAEAMKAISPPPSATRFWLHLGANVAGRDWQDRPGGAIALPSVDSQRVLAISPEFLPLASAVFAGQPGYEMPVSSKVLAAGELEEVIKAGYAPAAGVFGTHRYHHVAEDDERCLNAPATASAARCFRTLLQKVVAAKA